MAPGHPQRWPPAPHPSPVHQGAAAGRRARPQRRQGPPPTTHDTKRGVGMTCTTIVAHIADALGHCAWMWTDVFGDRHLDHAYALPADAFVDDQPGTIPIKHGHAGATIGY